MCMHSAGIVNLFPNRFCLCWVHGHICIFYIPKESNFNLVQTTLIVCLSRHSKVFLGLDDSITSVLDKPNLRLVMGLLSPAFNILESEEEQPVRERE